MVEQRQDSSDLFAAILEAMTALRESSASDPDPREAQREAWMRQTIRAAEAEGFQRIAVVCGAWHGPALAALPPARADAAVLKGLTKTKVAATWVPWTNGRLAWSSGYGAGIESPGWYQHLWTTPDQIEIRWLTNVARLLRGEGLDVSSAHVIEAVRLAEALAALRARPRPGLAELSEATLAVICAGNDAPLQLIHSQLIVGEQLGSVPPGTPMVPLQADLTREQRRLHLPAAALAKSYDLDLRKPTDLERSHLLHRLRLLGVAWGQLDRVRGRSTGTFHELWQLSWAPELAVAVIEASLWGTTILDAANARAADLAGAAPDLPALTALVDQVMLAELTGAVPVVMARLDAAAAVADDIAHLMEALAPLANVLRYGTVRRIDTTLVSQVVDGLVARIAVGLPLAAASLDDAAAAALYERLQQVNGAITLLDRADYLASWQATLRQLSDQLNVHGLIAGGVARLLYNVGQITADELGRRLSLALSSATDPKAAAAWIAGLVQGSSLLLLSDPTLLQLIDRWLVALPEPLFVHVLPLIRRTFAMFNRAERQRIGQVVSGGGAARAAAVAVDEARAALVLPLVAQLLGLTPPATVEQSL